MCTASQEIEKRDGGRGGGGAIALDERPNQCWQTQTESVSGRNPALGYSD